MGWSEIRDGSPRFSLFPNRSAERCIMLFSFSRNLAMDSMESSNTIGARAQREFEDLLKHDRAVVVAALVFVITVSWLYLLAGAGMGMSAFEMSSVSMAIGASMCLPMATAADWTWAYAFLMFGMWWAMMIAMMLPSAAPMILLFALVNRRSHAKSGPYVPTAVFAGAYLVAWGGFSVIAVALQWGLERAELLSPMMASRNVAFGGVLLVLAGAYQLSPLKHACLRQCRGPIDFISRHWRAGRQGAFRMGVHHGLYCIGCCWALMTLLFFGGAMNLYWIAGLALFVLLEKTIPPGHWLASLSGLGLVGWGVALLTAVA
jgi:predicted metal-binding membrane protein